VEPQPEIWVPVHASYKNNTMFFPVFWTKLFWSQSRNEKSQDVGAAAGAKKLDAQSWSRSLKLEYRLHNPARLDEWQSTHHTGDRNISQHHLPFRHHFACGLRARRWKHKDFIAHHPRFTSYLLAFMIGREFSHINSITKFLLLLG